MPTLSFNYLDEKNCYLDTACQCLRPQQVLEGELTYYVQSNACAGRGNYTWSIEVDERLREVRHTILEFVGKSHDQYTVVFCPNTTWGINLILQNLNSKLYKHILTTDKEHNSVLLPARNWSKQNDKPLHVISRIGHNEIPIDSLENISTGIALFQSVSNIDGHVVENIEQVVRRLKQQENLVLIDATQSLAHHNVDYPDLDFDCLFASAHKLYAPSMGFMIIKKDLILNLNQTWLGGGTVQSVGRNNHTLVSDRNELHSRLELGLQDYAAIFGLGEAIDWLKNFKVEDEYPNIPYRSHPLEKLKDRFIRTGTSREAVYYIESLGELLYSNLQKLQIRGKIELINKAPSSIISFVPQRITSYELTARLSEHNVMCRSGYLCCHYYLKEIKNLAPVTRVSIGLHNTPHDIAKLLKLLEESL